MVHHLLYRKRWHRQYFKKIVPTFRQYWILASTLPAMDQHTSVQRVKLREELEQMVSAPSNLYTDDIFREVELYHILVYTENVREVLHSRGSCSQ